MIRSRQHVPVTPRRAPVPAEALEPRLLMATFTVTTTANAGAGSLRQAIADANAAAGADVVRFALPVSGGAVATIRPTTPLPVIVGQLDIDGTTQSGYGPGRPVVELSGDSAGAGASGLVLDNTTNSRVRGLIVNRWAGNGIRVNGGSGAAVQSNYIGLSSDGNAAAANGVGVWVDGAAGVLVGGTTAAQRNFIGGNTTGVMVGRDTEPTAPVATNTAVRGNFIGTNAGGMSAVGNTSYGIRVAGANEGTVVGGTAAGAGNLVAGNASTGVAVQTFSNIPGSGAAPAARDARIEGNIIGVGSNGLALRNNTGILAGGGSVVIGGTAPGARNLISGNGTGVHVLRDQPRIEGNHIGVNAAGTAALPNTIGVQVESAFGTRVGGAEPGAGNVISGNVGAGLRIVNNGPGPLPAPDVFHRVQGNFIGTNAAGTAPIPNGAFGVELWRTTETLVGGATPAERNVISGNAGSGIFLNAAGGTRIIGNYIGTTADGAPLGNTGTPGHGINAGGVTLNSVISGNTIAHNAGGGIVLTDGQGNSFLSNLIYSNGGLNIDLGGDGLTSNDTNDSDTGANDRQNFPMLTSVKTDGANLFVRGTVGGARTSNTFRVQFFSAPTFDFGERGEAAAYLGEVTVTSTATTTTAEFAAVLPFVPVGHYVSATVTAKTSGASSRDQTSEFSHAAGVPQPDLVAPTITGVSVRRAGWSDMFEKNMELIGVGSVGNGFNIGAAGADQLKPLPWTGLNTIKIQFSEPVDVKQEHLEIIASVGDGSATPPTYAIASFSYAVASRTATWTLTKPVGADRLTLVVRSDAVKDFVGNRLDGEWADAADSYPSGNGVFGGDFYFRMNVLPGDVNRNGRVDVFDEMQLRRRYGGEIFIVNGGASPRYSLFANFNGDTRINALDYSLLRRNIRRFLP